MSITAFRQYRRVTEARNDLMPFLKECEIAGHDVSFQWHPQFGGSGGMVHSHIGRQVAIVQGGLVWVKVMLGNRKRFDYEYCLGEGEADAHEGPSLGNPMRIHSGQTDDVEELKDVIAERLRSGTTQGG